MKRFLLYLAILVIVAGGVFGYLYYSDANRDYTEWMDNSELTTYIKKFEVKPGATPDPWQRSHWITAAQGRWRKGIAEYRVRVELSPPQWEGFWFFDQDQQLFSKTLKYYGDEGFTLAYVYSFKLPDGTLRYQSVWHKTTK
jgi:hypothetical protein